MDGEPPVTGSGGNDDGFSRRDTAAEPDAGPEHEQPDPGSHQQDRDGHPDDGHGHQLGVAVGVHDLVGRPGPAAATADDDEADLVIAGTEMSRTSIKPTAASW